MILLRTRAGPGISPDSVSYLQTARNLLAGKGFLNYDGRPYVDWPPLFPAAVAAVSALGIDAEQAARWVNALAYGAMAAASGWWIRRRTGAVVAGIVASAVLLRAGAVSFVAVFAWSEPLFLLFAILSLFALARYGRRGDASALIAAALLAAAAVMTRYVGLALVATGAFVVLARPADARMKLRHLGLFISICCVPYAAWALRNARRTGTLTGGRAVDAGSLLENLRLLLLTAGGWIVPLDTLDVVRIAVAILAAAALAWVGVCLWRGGRRWDVLPPAAFVAMYAALLLAMATLTSIDAIEDRLAMPLLPPAVLLLALAAPRAFADRRRLLAGVASAALWFAFAPLHAAEEDDFAGQSGDYSTPEWRASPLVAWIRAHPPGGSVFSNDPWALFERARLRAGVAPLPPEDPDDAWDSGDLCDIADAVHAGTPTWVVWFTPDSDAPDAAAAFGDVLALTPVHRERDGTLYRVSRPAGGRRGRASPARRWFDVNC